MKLKLVIFIFSLLFLANANAQCDCTSPIIPPQTVNGLTITSNSTGSVSNYPSAFTSCGNITTPTNSIHLGAGGTFSYTLNFNSPIQEICVIITATGQSANENFIINTNTGVPTIIDQQSCFSTIVGNEILSGNGSGANGGGGIFQIVGGSSFTSITITGSGGQAGSLFAFCANSIVLPNSSIFGDTTVCQNTTQPEVIFVGSGTSSPYIFTYSINGGTSQTVTSVGDTAKLAVPTNVPGTFVYELSSIQDFNGTIETQTGTATVVVNPLPLATITGNTAVCQNATAPQVTFTGSNSTAPYTFTYTINGGAQQTVTSTGNTATVNVPTNTIGTFNYELISVEDASATACNQVQTGTATVVVNPLPLATITGNTAVCQNATAPQVTFTGSNSTAPYTFTYTINGGAQQTVTSTGNTATVNVPTNTTGTFNYELISVEDASTTACSQVQTGTATVVVNPLPLATITGNTAVCQNATAPQVTFTGSNSTAPYTFTYTINGGAQQTATSTGNTATVNVPTNTIGTFNYELISVEDASTTACSRVQTGTATVVVNPLPLATITGNTAVCQNATAPQVTFTGSNSTAPYTFTYTINGGAQQTTTSTGNTATVNVPTITIGTFSYELISVEDASATACSQVQTGTATVVVNPLPLATITGNSEICLNSQETPYITFLASNGTSPYTFTYSLNGQTSQTVSSGNGATGTVPVPTNQAGSFEYELLSVQDSSLPGCSQSQTGTVTVNVHNLPSATITGNDSICQNEVYPEVVFTGSLGDPSYTFSYSLNGVNQTVASGGNDNVLISVPTENAGTFVYTLNQVVESSLGCVQNLSESVTVVVHPLPIASFDPTPSKIIMSSNSSQMVNSSFGAESYIWIFPDGSLSHLESPRYSFNTEYVGQEFIVFLEAISEYGCRDYTEGAVIVEEELIIYVPNTFTPNGDGSNDMFIPIITEGVDPTDYSFKIYNRWGELIFESLDTDLGWDGAYYGKIAKDGTYVWQLEFQRSTYEERIIKTGSVNLLR